MEPFWGFKDISDMSDMCGEIYPEIFYSFCSDNFCKGWVPSKKLLVVNKKICIMVEILKRDSFILL